MALKNLDKTPTPKPTSEPTSDPILKPTTDLKPRSMVADTPKLTKKSQHKTPPFKLRKNFVNKFGNDEKNINNEIFREYIEYQNPSGLEKTYLKPIKLKIKLKISK